MKMQCIKINILKSVQRPLTPSPSVGKGMVSYIKKLLDLNWTPHINNITEKAKNTLRFVKRNVKTGNKKVKEIVYNTYVRPQMEYCSTIWNPWQKNSSAKN